MWKDLEGTVVPLVEVDDTLRSWHPIRPVGAPSGVNRQKAHRMQVRHEVVCHECLKGVERIVDMEDTRALQCFPVHLGNRFRAMHPSIG